MNAPRDEKGKLVPTACNLCGCGNLRHQGGRLWACDGLVDPEDVTKELEACPAFHFDGEPRKETPHD